MSGLSYTIPLVKLDMIRGVRSPEQIRILADVVQQALVDEFAVPTRDRYQVITQHGSGELIIEDTGLGIERSNDLLLIQSERQLMLLGIFQQGRDAKQKQALFATLAFRLEKECGLKGSDLVVSVSRNEKEDWSFGYERAQFLTGDL